MQIAWMRHAEHTRGVGPGGTFFIIVSRRWWALPTRVDGRSGAMKSCEEASQEACNAQTLRISQALCVTFCFQGIFAASFSLSITITDFLRSDLFTPPFIRGDASDSQAPWLTSIYDPDTFLPHTRRPSVCLSLDPSASATFRRQHVGAQDAHHQPTLGRQAHSHAIFHARTGRLERRLVRCGTDALAAPLALACALRAAQCAHPARHAQHGHAHAFVVR